MILRNEKGVGGLIVIVLMVLVLLTIIGIASVNMSNTELKIATNHQIHVMCFYAAESGIALGPIMAKEEQLSEEWEGWPEDGIIYDGSHSNGTHYEYTITKGPDDPFYTLPNILVVSDGTHKRAGLSKIAATFRYIDVGVDPKAALWVSSIVSANGNVTISGEDASGEGPSVAGIKHVLPTTEENLSINKFHDGQLLGEPAFTNPAVGDGLYEYERDDVLKLVDVIITEEDIGENAFDLCDYIGETSADHPIIVAITAPNAKISGNCEGYGLLYSTGNLEITGTVSWHGMVLVDGDTEMKGGGSGIMVDGSMIVGGETTALLGNVTVHYNSATLKNITNHISRYIMTSWRQI